jgi:hypothetical protein
MTFGGMKQILMSMARQMNPGAILQLGRYGIYCGLFSNNTLDTRGCDDRENFLDFLCYPF